MSRVPGIALYTLIFVFVGTTFAADVPIRLERGPHLFIDNYLIADQANLKRTINHPVRLPHPVVTAKEDKNFQPYVTVLRDSKSGRFRIWYGIPESASQTHLAYMESGDGIHWLRPHRVLADPARIQFGTSVIDDGPNYPDPGKRFKWGWWNDGGLNVAASPDGLTWKVIAPGVVLEHNHDISCIFRDPVRNRYLAMVSSYTEDIGWEGNRRVTMQSVSDDLIHWKKPWYAITPDEKDEGDTQFYCMGGLIARGDLLIGLLRVLRDDLPADSGGPVAGIGYTVLAWSRDGEHWQRDREPFLDRNQQPHTWDHAMTWGDCQLVVGDETYIYYGGYARGHKIERFKERQIGLARMPLDHYVAREAEATQGTLTTPLVFLDAESMKINAKADGRIAVRILDWVGQPLPGFDWSDCKPIRGDSVRHLVQWGSSLALLRHKPVRLQFSLSNASLYGFELCNEEITTKSEGPSQSIRRSRIYLHAPKTSGGIPLTEALAKRRSHKSLKDTFFTQFWISQLCWAAQGITNAESGKRTAPSALALYAVHVFLVDDSGAYEYSPQQHALFRLSVEDAREKLRAAVGQASVKSASLSIVLAMEPARLEERCGKKAERYSLLEAGHIAQNVLLQATAMGLASVPIGGIDEGKVAAALGLPAGVRPVYVLPLGYPAED